MDFEIVACNGPTPKQPAICKGRIYRARQNVFQNARGDIVYKDSFTLMKRLSCPGCEVCSWIDDYLNDCLQEEGPEVVGNIRPEALYELTITDSHTDYETGICDEFILGLKRINKGEE